MTINRPVPEPDHSLPSSTQVKKKWEIPPLPLHAFMARTGIPLPFSVHDNIYHKITTIRTLTVYN